MQNNLNSAKQLAGFRQCPFQATYGELRQLRHLFNKNTMLPPKQNKNTHTKKKKERKKEITLSWRQPKDKSFRVFHRFLVE